jgi:phenylalanyl-tRNA synthetase beta chain
MKISYNWLKTLINIELPVNELADKLTAAGLEVEGIESFESMKGGLKGLVVGHILECGKHPDADRLSLTRVDIGTGEPLSIVCGAPNVAAGQKVIVATVGTKLFPMEGEPFEIKKSKIRGAASEGMICAEDEIGLGKSHAGIMVLPADTKVGLLASEYFKLENDFVLEIGLTPNRSDAASHLGVARDISAILNSTPRALPIQTHINGLHTLPEGSGLEKIDILIQQSDACKRYSGMVINGITVTDSPEWLKNKLKCIGLRPINNIVDITNFVLHELGQPLHAFDTDKIKGKQLIVKTANEGEKFVTLDSVERTLKSNDLMICDSEKSLCIAGVFGGLESGVSEKTTSVFLESAYFDSGYVRRTAKQHGLKTDASFRFERGTDPDMTVTALIRAANLIIEIAGGNISMDILDIYPEKMEPYKVAFSYENCTDLIGKEIDRGIIKSIIQSLGMEVETEGSDGILLKVPRYKTDVTRSADVVEEVMRIYGFNNIEASRAIQFNTGQHVKNQNPVLENKLGALLEGMGFNEIMSLSLSKETYYSEQDNLVKVMNPLSNDLGVLRRDLIYSGLEAIIYNTNRKNSDLKLFEFGRTYQLSKGEEIKYEEEKQVSIFVTGNIFTQNPYSLNQKADFSYLKNVVTTLLEKFGVQNLKTVESHYDKFTTGLTYLLNNKPIVELGIVSKKELKQFDITQEVAYAKINWNVLAKAYSKQKIEFEELSKFPSVRRDLALLIDKSVSYQAIEELAFATEKKLLKEVNLFDIYESEKLGNKKSYAVSFTLLNTETTLTDKQIDSVMDKLIANYKEKLGAELR